MQPVHTPEGIFTSTLDLLERLTAISSPSGDLEGLGEAAELLAGELAQRGLATDIRREPGADGRLEPVLYARTPSTPGRRHILAIGHLDTVLEACRPLRDGDRLHATGAIDMKGGLAAFVGAIDLLLSRGGSLPVDFLLAVVPDEEVAGHLSKKVVEKLGAEARGLWVLEPGQRIGDAETLVSGRRGLFDWQLTVRGQSAHSGNAYWQGRSAAFAAAEWCGAIRRLISPGTGPTINIGRVVAGDTSFVSDLARGADLVGTNRQLNIVPDLAIVEGEARFLRPDDGISLRQGLVDLASRIASQHEVDIDCEIGEVVQPVDPRGAGREGSHRAVEFAEKAGWKLELEEERGGISFSNFLPDPSAIPTLDGLGPIGDGMHTREEFVELPSLDRRISLLADLLEDLT